ncbi:hypothetical protein Ahy_B05g075882 [Arachis hypogaea]|uniref:Uncharacterized protein n=1 Tax=Arachis hypogaea TaxID=3818 RepID=A0A444Z272_ARAHY|nr:hypothetical protein Ahy_B05g075882 [Arachis hypogaea]
MLEDVRERCDHLTTWLCPEIKKALYVHWETNEGFRHWCLINRANRASAMLSKYTTKARLVCSLFNSVVNLIIFFNKSLVCILTTCFNATCVVEVVGSRCDIGETFKYIHTLKENKEKFADQRSQNQYESYTQRLEVATQQSQKSGEDASGSIASVIGLDAVWHEITSAPYKNCVYGLAVDPEEGIDLRLHMHELTRSLHDQAQELTKTQERYKKILTRVADTNDLRWMEGAAEAA